MPETLAFVIPWYGPGIAGGAEAECRATAGALAARGLSVEILTTCARDHASPGADDYPEGPDEIGGLPVRRFKVRPRDPARHPTEGRDARASRHPPGRNGPRARRRPRA